MPGKRTMIAPRSSGKRYVRRTARGQFTAEQESVGRSLTQDRRRKAKSAAKPGYGDRGDRRPQRATPRRRPRARKRSS
jgi:hypothetical protein